ncbi:MAG: hypothetical protein QOI25_2126, partial [Mycobacterium sp.]|jgi:hypothetical protein|nr:hypothetical protein [Mycobacterium sp.]MDT5323912.1 hypothetical protein [Mycobacterium sp.]
MHIPNTSRPLARLAISGLVTGGLAAAALGLGAGTAAAGGPYTWCPGQNSGIDIEHHTGAPGAVNWDMNVCHTWWYVNWGFGNINPGIWDGDNPPPPPEALEPRQCPPFAFMCP